jgi:hypothetical protein
VYPRHEDPRLQNLTDTTPESVKRYHSEVMICTPFLAAEPLWQPLERLKKRLNLPCLPGIRG